MTRTAILQKNNAYTQSVATILGEMQQHSEIVLNSRPADGGWSAMQTMHHLILSEERSLAYVHKKLSFDPAFDTVSLGARWRSFLLWFSLSSPFKFKAPAAISNENLPNHATLADTRERWLKARAEWAEFFEKMPDTLLDKEVYKHPRAGKLSWGGMLWFFDTHFKRHRAQMRRAILAQ